MLVLSRRIDERIIIGERIEVKVIQVRQNRVTLGIMCDKSIPIRRHEIPALPRSEVPNPSESIELCTIDAGQTVRVAKKAEATN